MYFLVVETIKYNLLSKNFAGYYMRKILREQIQMGEIDISAVEIELHNRDEIPQLLRGLQHIYRTPAVRSRVFDLLLELVPDGIQMENGRSGMDLWKIMVLGTLRLNCNWDYDKLQEIANNHRTIRQMLGHGILDTDVRYPRQTLCDNIRWFTPEILEKINTVVVEEGLRVAGKDNKSPLIGRCDSFVVETDVHFPTDINLLWDAARKVLTLTHRFSEEVGIEGWRQAPHLLRKVKRLFRSVQRFREKDKEKKSNKDCLAAATRNYIDAVKDILERAVVSILPYQRSSSWHQHIAEEIGYFCKQGSTLIDQIERRCFKGEKIPHEEKIFSLFEPYTEWISKGKAGVSQELGLRVVIVESSEGFILHHRVMEQETDDRVAVPIIKETKALFKNLRSCSFDKGFHSPENQEKLSGLLDFCVLPRKGHLDQAQRKHESGHLFKEKRRKHSAVESAINALENHGLDRVLDKGIEGFKRYVALSVVSRNLQILGRLLQEKELEAWQKECRENRKAA